MPCRLTACIRDLPDSVVRALAAPTPRAQGGGRPAAGRPRRGGGGTPLGEGGAGVGPGWSLTRWRRGAAGDRAKPRLEGASPRLPRLAENGALPQNGGRELEAAREMAGVSSARMEWRRQRGGRMRAAWAGLGRGHVAGPDWASGFPGFPLVLHEGNAVPVSQPTPRHLKFCYKLCGYRTVLPEPFG